MLWLHWSMCSSGVIVLAAQSATQLEGPSRSVYILGVQWGWALQPSHFFSTNTWLTTSAKMMQVSIILTILCIHFTLCVLCLRQQIAELGHMTEGDSCSTCASSLLCHADGTESAVLCFNRTSSSHFNCVFVMSASERSGLLRFLCLLWSNYSLQASYACPLVT